ncbi:MAG TPA: hypothetical protein VHH36_08880 [Candidatus Thermoplasmatota archaeon]|nr:hypothetical protein [Candidatus Thermoplasmatota archaeon]
MVSARQKAALAALLVLAAAVGAGLGLAGAREHAPSAPQTRGHDLPEPERCAHMPEHCPAGGDARG